MKSNNHVIIESYAMHVMLCWICFCSQETDDDAQQLRQLQQLEQKKIDDEKVCY